MEYNYYENIKEDVKEAIKERYNNDEIIEGLDENKLYDDLFIDDSVTGNASGSYTFSTYKAEEYIAHNLDLLKEAIEEFGGEYGEALERGAEFCDVTIRCYLLSQVIGEAIEELQEEIEEN